MASLWRCTTTSSSLRRFLWSQRRGSAEQFKEGGTYGQSRWELESTLLLRHSMSPWIFVHVPATSQELHLIHYPEKLVHEGVSLHQPSRCSWPQLIEAAEICLKLSHNPISGSISLHWASTTLSSGAHHASSFLGKPWSRFKSEVFISLLETSDISPQQLLECFSMTRRAHTCLTACWDEVWPCTRAQHCGLSMDWKELVHTGQIYGPAFEGHSYGTHGYGIYGCRIILPPSPNHHPGKFAGGLVQKNQQCQCFVYMVIERGETPVSDFPDLHILLHGDPLNTARGAGAKLWWANPDTNCSRNCLFISSSASQHKPWGHTEKAGVSRWEKDILGRELVGSIVRKMLPLERCCNRDPLERCCNKDKMLQMSTGYHRIPEKPHSFSAAGLFIHKIVFLPYIQVITDSFCTARAPLTSSVRLFIAAAAQAESSTST